MTLSIVLRLALRGLILTTCLAVAHPALAEVTSFKAELKGNNEVPPNDSKVGTILRFSFPKIPEAPYQV